VVNATAAAAAATDIDVVIVFASNETNAHSGRRRPETIKLVVAKIADRCDITDGYVTIEGSDFEVGGVN
jgi:hypothetical protein